MRKWILLLFVFLAYPTFAQTLEIDRIAAHVNDEVILESEIAIENRMAMRFMDSKPPVSLSREELLKRLIERRLLLSEARSFPSIVIDESMVKTRFQKIRDSFDDEKDWLAFKTALAMSDFEWNQYLHDSLLIENYIEQRIRAFIRIQPKAVDDYIRDHKTELGLKELRIEKGHIAVDPELWEKINLLLRERAINTRLETHVEELRKKSEIFMVRESSD